MKGFIMKIDLSPKMKLNIFPAIASAIAYLITKDVEMARFWFAVWYLR